MVNRISISKEAYKERADNFVVELKSVSPIKFDKLTPAIATKLFADDSFIKVKNNYVILKHAIHALTLLADKDTQYNSKIVSVPKMFKF